MEHDYSFYVMVVLFCIVAVGVFVTLHSGDYSSGDVVGVDNYSSSFGNNSSVFVPCSDGDEVFDIGNSSVPLSANIVNSSPACVQINDSLYESVPCYGYADLCFVLRGVVDEE